MVTGGMIHDEIDMKLLILYVMKRLPGPIDKESLFDICICDNGVEYFEYSDYLHELVENGHIEETEYDEYIITEKGIRNGETLETSLPKSVRIAAEKALAPVAVELRRRELIHATRTSDSSGVTVHLSLSDGDVELVNLSLYCGDDSRANAICRSFRKNAERQYGEILALLSEPGGTAGSHTPPD